MRHVDAPTRPGAPIRIGTPADHRKSTRHWMRGSICFFFPLRMDAPVYINAGRRRVLSQAKVIAGIESVRSDSRCLAAQEAIQYHSAFVASPDRIAPPQIASGMPAYLLCIGGLPTQGFTIGALKHLANVAGFIALPICDHLFSALINSLCPSLQST